MFVDPNETIWIGHRDWDPRGSVYGVEYTLRAYGRRVTNTVTRAIPEVALEPARVTGPDGRPHGLPYSPTLVWRVTPSGALIVGASDTYQFEIHVPDGPVTRVRREVELPALSAEEADWMRRIQIAVGRAPEGWDGAELPDRMPAFMSFVPAQSGEIWVNRFAPSAPVPGCADTAAETRDELMGRGPCWERTRGLDVFGSDGRFLGPIELPDELRELNQLASPWIDGDRFIMAVADDAGTIMVKRYRLVLPGEQ